MLLTIHPSLSLPLSRYRVSSNPDGPLLSSSLRSFIESLSARTSAPGGGSASAVSASMVREREGGRGRGREGEGEAFIESLAARTSAPGGGSASAVSASMVREREGGRGRERERLILPLHKGICLLPTVVWLSCLGGSVGSLYIYWPRTIVVDFTKLNSDL